MAFLRTEAGDKLLLERGTDALLLEGEFAAAATSPHVVVVVHREWPVVTHKEGVRTVGTLTYVSSAEDPPVAIWWLDRAGNLIDFSSGYSWSVKISTSDTTLVTKTSGVTGATGSGTAPTGTPNVVIDWSAGELNITPGAYTLEVTPTTGGRQRSALRVPIRIIGAAT